MAKDAELTPAPSLERAQIQVATTSFLSLFSIVGIALYGLPFFYDFMVRDFGWSRAQVTSGNALSKLVVGPLLGFAAGWIVDRFGPRRLMIAGILMAGTALVGSHDEIAERIEEYRALGCDEFILSGFPHLEEVYWVAEGVLPLLRRPA